MITDATHQGSSRWCGIFIVIVTRNLNLFSLFSTKITVKLSMCHIKTTETSKKKLYLKSLKAFYNVLFFWKENVEKACLELNGENNWIKILSEGTTYKTFVVMKKIF